jgi:hypothetical protein
MLLFVSYFPEQNVVYMNNGVYEIDVRSNNYNIIKDIHFTSMVFHIKRRDIDIALQLRGHTNYGVETNIFITEQVNDESAILLQCQCDTDLNMHVHFI